MNRILHITPWFKSPERPLDAQFIYNHVRAFNRLGHNAVLHVDFRKGSVSRWKTDVRDLSGFSGLEHLKADIPVVSDSWREKELRAFWFLKAYLAKHALEYDIVNFYIAYPLAIRLDYFRKKYPQIRFIITEQWSAYHTGFDLPRGNKGRNRIEAIFGNDVPLFVVSSSLGEDICRFAGKNIPYQVLPNIIEKDLFTFREKTPGPPFTICSVNFWSAMKNPFVLIESIVKLRQEGLEAELVLGGQGMLSEAMHEAVKKLDAEAYIHLPGNLNRTEVARTIQEAHVYCQSSVYETFSVVCIEALSTGTPVLAHNVGGMRDFVNDTNGGLVESLETEDWTNALRKILMQYDRFDRERISRDTSAQYSAERVADRFYNLLSQE